MGWREGEEGAVKRRRNHPALCCRQHCCTSPSFVPINYSSSSRPHRCTITGQLIARPSHSRSVVCRGSGLPSTGTTQQRWCDAVRAAQRSAAGWRGERLTRPLGPLTLICRPPGGGEDRQESKR